MLAIPVKEDFTERSRRRDMVSPRMVTSNKDESAAVAALVDCLVLAELLRFDSWANFVKNNDSAGIIALS